MEDNGPRGEAFALFLRPHLGVFRQLMCPHLGLFARFFLKNAYVRGLVPGVGERMGTAGID